MERSFVFVLTLVTLAQGTPHGYGVKGGASAKAEASAAAGAFGGLGPLPLSIPSGSGYSGSFSKSSSSSFASSSASASSSSFSFSGSGTNGIAGIGIDKGCSSCPGTGAAGQSLNGDHQLAGAPALAKAVSPAQASGVSGGLTPCQGSSCSESPSEKCTSGQCLTDSTEKHQTGCAGNPNCQPLSSKSDLSGSEDKDQKDKDDGNYNDSNDFAVNINRNPQSKLSHDSNGQYFNKDKSYNPESDCSNGKCGSGYTDQSNFSNNKNGPPVPSTYLTAPNTNPPCTTPNCNYPSHNVGPQSSGLPSSYNVPIQSATNPPNTYYSSPSTYGSPSSQGNNVASGVPCTSPNCDSTSYNVKPDIPNYQSGQQGPNNHGLCASGHCDTPTSSNGKTNNDAVIGAKVPSYSHGNIPSNVPSWQPGQSGCTGPYCSALPTYGSYPTNQGNGCSGTACGGTSPISSPTKLSDSKAPMYTGGFGGPPGFLDINSGNNKVPGNSAHNSHNSPSSSRPTGSYGSSPIPASLGITASNNNYGSTQLSSHGGSTAGFDYNKPSSVPSISGSHYNPSATGSHGAPTAPSVVSLASHPSPLDNGNYKPTTDYSGSSPTYSGGIGGSTGSSLTSTGSNSIHGSYGVTKPHTPSDHLNGPIYTGGFGAPSGTGGFNSGSSPCGSAGCNSPSNGNINGGTYNNINPNNNQNKPVYTGGFGGPAGFLNSNNVNIPSNTPAVSPGATPCANGNCGSTGTPISSQGTSLSSAHNLVSASANANAAVYSGGFGGPPGFLKPHDGGKINTNGLNGNFANGQSPSSNNGHVDTPSVGGKNPETASPAIGASSGAQASATASATAGSYGGINNNGSSRGCNSGCSPNGAADGNFGSPEELAKTGSGAGALAAAKGTATANAFGNFASSSASAHASAGAATKGGYGRK